VIDTDFDRKGIVESALPYCHPGLGACLLVGVAAAVFGFGSPREASSATFFDFVWTSKNGAATSQSGIIAAANGDLLTGEIRMAVDSRGVDFYSISLEFDTALDDELDFDSAVGFTPIYVGIGGNPESWTESTLTEKGNVLSFSDVCPVPWPSCGFPDQTLVIGQVTFAVANVASDGPDIFLGLFSSPPDGFTPNSGPGEWEDPVFGTATVVPEPSTTLLLAFGLAGIAGMRRRSAHF
jgi:hypothetical protein